MEVALASLVLTLATVALITIAFWDTKGTVQLDREEPTDVSAAEARTPS